MSLFGRKRQHGPIAVVGFDSDGNLQGRDPSQLLRYGYRTNKGETGYFVAEHQLYYQFADGSQFNATTGEVYDATGDGFLECTGTHWSYET
jgi:hypothetical protein